MPTDSPLVSIIIPTYNRAPLIGETLDSLVAQTYQNWECIVVDDGSTDNTAEMMARYIEKDARFQYYHRPGDRPKGANACRNFGFELSRGEYIIFLDSDDFLLPRCLETRLEVLLANPNIDYLIANTGIFLDGIKTPRVINVDPVVTKGETFLTMFLSYKIPWPIHSVMWKKEILNNSSFNEKLLRLQDLEFHILILINNNYKGERIFVVDNYYRMDNSKWNSSAHVTEVLHSLKQFIPNIIGKVNNKPELTKAFKKMLYNFIHYYIYPHYSENKAIATNVEKIILNAGIFSIKEIALLKMKKIIEVKSLDKVKGLGIYRLNKFINRSLS